jgi:NTE family protein
VPISLLQNPSEHKIIVVGLHGPDSEILCFEEKKAKHNKYLTLPSWVVEYRGKMKQFFPEQDKSDFSLSSFNLMTRSFDLLQDRFCELLVAQQPVDVMIQVARNQAGTMEFHRASELIEIGRQKAIKALDQWENGNH